MLARALRVCLGRKFRHRPLRRVVWCCVVCYSLLAWARGVRKLVGQISEGHERVLANGLTRVNHLLEQRFVKADNALAGKLVMPQRKLQECLSWRWG